MSILKNIIASNIVRKVSEAFDKPAGYPDKQEKPEKKTRETSQESAKGRSAGTSVEKPGN